MRSSLARRLPALSLSLACALAALGCDDDLVGVAGTSPPTAIDAPALLEPSDPVPDPRPPTCASALDCPQGDPASSCRAHTCRDGACVPIVAPTGLACTGDALGDCQIGRCADDGTCVPQPADDGSVCRAADWAGCQGFLCEAGACVPVAIGCAD